MNRGLPTNPGRPSPEALRRTTPADIGRRLLPFIAKYERGVVLRDFARSFANDYPRHEVEELQLILMEGMSWLVQQGLLVEDPSQMIGSAWYKISRAGRRYIENARPPTSMALEQAALSLMHPEIIAHAVPTFERGPDSYVGAVVMAFLSVEAAIRERIHKVRGTATTAIARDLVIEAFGEKNGVLVPPSMRPGEVAAIRELFWIVRGLP